MFVLYNKDETQKPGQSGHKSTIQHRGNKKSRWGEFFRTRPDRPWGPPSLLYNGYRVSFPGVKRPGCGANHTPHLAPSTKSRATPVLPIWAFMHCYRATFTFTSRRSYPELIKFGTEFPANILKHHQNCSLLSPLPSRVMAAWDTSSYTRDTQHKLIHATHNKNSYTRHTTQTLPL
jgi:hypothetical protein